MSTKRRIGLGFAAVVLAAAAGGVTASALGLVGDDSSSAPAGAQSGGAGAAGDPAASTGVYGDPTRSEQPAEADPTEVATDLPRPATAEDGSRDVIVTYSGFDAGAATVEVDGYVASVVETGGICTLTLTKDGASVRVSAPAEPDASTTSCGALRVPADQLSAGTWRAVLGYESAQSSGTSDPVEVAVP